MSKVDYMNLKYLLTNSQMILHAGNSVCDVVLHPSYNEVRKKYVESAHDGYCSECFGHSSIPIHSDNVNEVIGQIFNIFGRDYPKRISLDSWGICIDCWMSILVQRNPILSFGLLSSVNLYTRKELREEYMYHLRLPDISWSPSQSD